MKKHFLFLVISIFFFFNLFSVFPKFYGARSLSLGCSSTASNFDVNAIFMNPGLLSSIPYSMTGYQYQQNYSDYHHFADNLKDVLKFDLKNFDQLPLSEKQDLIARLDTMFNSLQGMYGSNGNIPGFVAPNYGFSISLIHTAIMNPQASDIFSKNMNDLSNEDIASLHMNMIGLRYTRYSLAYAISVSPAIKLGVGLHYLNGRVSKFAIPLVDDIFTPDSSKREYLKFAWEEAEHKFNKIVTDIGISANIGSYFKAGLVARNIGNPLITGPNVKIKLQTRYTAGLAFTPDRQLGIYFDVDLDKSELLYNGKMIQPISLGIEKGFFKNQFFLRAGIYNDLTEKYFFGSKSNILYGLGLGFNMGKIFLDAAMGMNQNGEINNLAISGFFIIK